MSSRGIMPQACSSYIQAVRALQARGLSILYTTRDIEDVEALCDRIAIMDEGRPARLVKVIPVIDRRLCSPPLPRPSVSPSPL